MNNTIEYRGYIGSIEFSEKDCTFYGKVQGIRALISYEGTTGKKLLADFHGAIDEYLETCATEGKEPEKAFKGSFNVRVSPERHRTSAIYAIKHQMTLNRLVDESIAEYLANHA